MALQQKHGSQQNITSLSLPYSKITPIIRKHIIKRFGFLKEKDIPDQVIHNYAKKYSVSDAHVSKELLRYIIDDLVSELQKEHRLKTSIPSSAFDDTVKTKEYFVSIDSKDRNYEQWPNANEYSIDFGGIHNNHTQNRCIMNHNNSKVPSNLHNNTLKKFIIMIHKMDAY